MKFFFSFLSLVSSQYCSAFFKGPQVIMSVFCRVFSSDVSTEKPLFVCCMINKSHFSIISIIITTITFIFFSRHFSFTVLQNDWTRRILVFHTFLPSLFCRFLAKTKFTFHNKDHSTFCVSFFK